MKKIELEQRLNELGSLLLSELKQEGYWEGRLSSSALAVAVSVTALHFHNSHIHAESISKGLNWLRMNINSDGSFGDTPESPGNVSSSLLVYAAFNLYSESTGWIKQSQHRIAKYLSGQGVEVNSSQISKSVINFYKSDYTFSVPILTMCGLCGIPGENAFNHIPQLPFELSLLPRRLYRLLNLGVVSYALPALVAVGIVIYRKKNSNFLMRCIRRISIPRAMSILHQILPESGGFLEASPLTAFVSMSLINAGYKDSTVVLSGIRFLKSSQREDGSWPIDVNLSTWVTSLAVKAFRSGLPRFLNAELQERVTKHFRLIQNKKVHPFNGTSPGGWGWTNHTGSVPDGDDTPGVLLALMKLQPHENVKKEVLEGCTWLLMLQNRDGGFPTFSKGWGKLPFDQSCSDLTGHNLVAVSSVIETYSDTLPSVTIKKFFSSFKKALDFLRLNQRMDGSWLPLWFGNQYTKDHSNPVYGTARVISYLKDAAGHKWVPVNEKEQLQELIEKGVKYLVSVQNEDGSWGGGKNILGTIEETALAVSALASAEQSLACHKGLRWLDTTYRNSGLKASPIGLYFASLWYDEKLYPVTAYLEAVSRMLETAEV